MRGPPSHQRWMSVEGQGRGLSGVQMAIGAPRIPTVSVISGERRRDRSETDGQPALQRSVGQGQKQLNWANCLGEHWACRHPGANALFGRFERVVRRWFGHFQGAKFAPIEAHLSEHEPRLILPVEV